MRRQGAPRLPAALLLAAATLVAPLVRSFVASPASAAGRPHAVAERQARRASGRRSRTLAAAVEGSVTAPAEARPLPPNSTNSMTLQAATAAMSAYKDGIVRQSVRLRLDQSYNALENYAAGIAAKLKGTLPLAQAFTQQLWSGEMLKGVRTQAIDEEVGTLLYRQATDNLYDSAVFFLVGRQLVTAGQMRNYFNAMGDRLVVLLNSADAADPFKIENKARDFVLGEDADAGKEVVDLFKEMTYFYEQTPCNNWQMIQFRAYPHPWEIWIETLDYELVKLGDFPEKPAYNEIIAAMTAYEEENNVTVAKKLGKMLKEQGSEFEAFTAAQMDPGEGRVL